MRAAVSFVRLGGNHVRTRALPLTAALCAPRPATAPSLALPQSRHTFAFSSSSSSAPPRTHPDDEESIPFAFEGNSTIIHTGADFSTHVPEGLSASERRHTRTTNTSASPPTLRPASQEWVTDVSRPIRERYHGAMFNYHFFAGNIPCRPLGLTYTEVMATLSDPRTSPFSSSGADLLPWLFPSLAGSDDNLDSAPLEHEEIAAFHHYPDVLRRYCRAVEAALARMAVTADLPSGRISSSRRSLELCTVPVPVFVSTISTILVSLRDMGFAPQAFSVIESLARVAGSTGSRLQPLYSAAMTEWVQHVLPDDQVKLQTLFRYWNSTGSFVKWTALLHMRKMQVQKATMLNRASDYTLHHVVKAGTPQARAIGAAAAAGAATGGGAAGSGAVRGGAAPAVPPPPTDDAATSAAATSAAATAAAATAQGKGELADGADVSGTFPPAPAAGSAEGAGSTETVSLVAAAPGSTFAPSGKLTPAERQALKEARRSQWAQRREGALAARWYSGVYAEAVAGGNAHRDMKMLVTGGGAKPMRKGKLPSYHVQVMAMERAAEKAASQGHRYDH